MKKTIIVSALIFGIISLGQAQVKLHKWTDAHYEKYTYESFQKLSVVKQTIDPDDIDYPLFCAAVFYATNIEREKHKLPRYKHSAALEKAAQDNSEDMVKKNFYSHTSPIKGKKKMSDRLALVGIENVNCAENIFDKFEKEPTYWGYALGLVKGWMDSPGHRRNILGENYKYLGCGVYYYVNKEWQDYFWVKSTQNFSSKDAE
jgi:uncharacterized protein YkwD